VFKKFAWFAICGALVAGSALAQDAKTVIANAQKALGDVKSITYSGSAKDVAFQQCGANSTDIIQYAVACANGFDVDGNPKSPSANARTLNTVTFGIAAARYGM